MNCPNCGAAMTYVDQREYFVCNYCTTFHFPKLPDTGPDRVKVLDGQSTYACPLCDMPLVEALLERERVLHCTHCRGILASNDAFAAVVRDRRRQREGEPPKPRPLDPTQLSRQIVCPVCERRMDTHPYYGPGSVVIDTCSRCFVIWLDHGELGVITTAPGRV